MRKQKKRREPKPDAVAPQGWLFFVARPCYVVVKGTYAEALAARQKILDMGNTDGSYVDWFKDIPNVDRAGTSDDPCELVRGPWASLIEEY